MGIKRKIASKLPDFAYSILDYSAYHQYIPNIVNPETLNEKVLYRKLHDRRPLLTQLADKYAVREYVESKVGPDILTELYYVTTEPETIPFDTLPDRFVIKPTHGSGWIKIVTDKSTIDRQEIIRECRAWLAQSFYKLHREYVYKHIEPKIIVEEFIDDGNATTPNDYKLFTYDGVPLFIQADADRFNEHTRDYYNPAWERLPVTLTVPHAEAPLPRPKHLEELLKAAQLLGKGIDFLRIDLYDTEQKVYFGELTTTPDNCKYRFDPPEYNRIFGEHWKIR